MWIGAAIVLADEDWAALCADCANEEADGLPFVEYA